MKIVRELESLTPEVLGREVEFIDVRIREGRFQRWLSLIAGLSSVLAGLEVSYEHYRGSYSNRIMYTPVILSGAMAGAGIWGFFNRWAATWLLRSVSAITLVDSVTGFVFHIRGVQRKPGGWSLPVNNIVMGPPLFAPLLFGISGYLGLTRNLGGASCCPLLRTRATGHPGLASLIRISDGVRTCGKDASRSTLPSPPPSPSSSADSKLCIRTTRTGSVIRCSGRRL